jgi:hypothetical protein
MTQIDGIDGMTAMTIISEAGWDLSKWTSGWSEPSSRAGLSPSVDQRLFTAHALWRFITNNRIISQLPANHQQPLNSPGYGSEPIPSNYLVFEGCSMWWW